MKKSIASAVTVLLLGGLLSIATPASATNDTPPGECVPSEAVPGYWEDVPDITHPAVGEPKITIENPDYQPATDGTSAIWANFSPNDQQATFIGPAIYPTDERGTWHDHGQLPPGQAGPDGVYANGNPDKGGNWFYRQAAVEGTDAVGTPTIEVDNPDYKPEWIEVTPNKWHDPVDAVTCEEEPPPVLNNCTPQQGTHSTNLNDLWQNVDTRSAGHLEYVEGGLHIWTDDNSSQAKVSEGLGTSFPLHDTGTLELVWEGSTPAPGINLFVTFEPGVTGTLVYEAVYGQDLWLTNGSSQAAKDNAPVNGGGNGSQWHGTIDQWLTKYPNAQVTPGIAYSLGSGVLGDGVIKSITAGCATHTFDFEEEIVIPEEPKDIVTVTETEDVNCDSKVVTTTTTTSTTTHRYDQETNTWIANEPMIEMTSSERPATEAECPTPPVEEPEEPEEPVTPEKPAQPEQPQKPAARVAGELAVTGSDTDWSTVGLIGFGIIALGAVITVATRRRSTK